MFLVLSTFLLSTASMAAGDFMGELMMPAGFMPTARARYEYRHYGNAGANHENLSLQQSKLDLSGALLKTENTQWRAHGSADYDSLQTKAQFPNGKLLPSRLWDIGAGISHSRTLSDERTLGGNFTVGSASDRPFSAGRDLGFSLNVAYKIPEENEAAWILFLSISNTRGFLNYIPLPGFAYSFKAGDKTRMVLGLPFAMIFWRPSNLWTITFLYFPIRTTELRLSYGSPRGPQPYILASFRSRNFRLTDRANKDERLFNEEGLFQGGLNLPLSRAFAIDLAGGLAFGRRYFLAEKLSQHSTAPLVKAENAIFGHLKTTASF